MNRAVAESSRCNLIGCRTRHRAAEKYSERRQTTRLKSVRFVRLYEEALSLRGPPPRVRTLMSPDDAGARRRLATVARSSPVH